VPIITWVKMALVNYLTNRSFALKALLLLLGAFYLIAGALAKHGDYWVITNISMAFAVDPLHFMARTTGVAYPPTFYALQGAWLWLGSHLFHYNLAISYDMTNSTLYPYIFTRLGIFPFWGMIPILAALFLFVGIAYKELRNKWLALICFAPITFVSVIIMGQIDVVCVLFIFASLILLQRALKAEKYFSLLLLGYLALGVSLQFKTYGGLLLPAYIIYTLALVRTRKLDTPKLLFTLGSCVAVFLVATFIVWLPYPEGFNTIILNGYSGWLLRRPSLLFQVPVWLLGYVFILCYTAVRVLRKPLTSLRDDRYFFFDNFAIVAWFFISVFTEPQWWIFLIPPALLVLDSFRSKNEPVFCILILITYLFYPMNWPGLVGVFASYHIPALLLTKDLSRWIFTVLASLLLFWVFALNEELRSTKAGLNRNADL
jgi:Dolichyl-phosphate-mannose-protein mannosyltransferase